jgi:hypothetical protein
MRRENGRIVGDEGLDARRRWIVDDAGHLAR